MCKKYFDVIKSIYLPINKSKNISLDKFIYSIGIRHIGQENAKILAAFFTSIEEFLNLFKVKERQQILKNLVELDGIGTKLISIQSLFQNHLYGELQQHLIK